MAKCVELPDGRIYRTTDEEAAHLVKTSGAKYVGKEQWKQQRKDDNDVIS